MADGTPVISYPGGTTYDTIATEDVAGKKVQKVKLDAGAANASVPIIAGQKTMAQSVPVVLASDQPAAALPTGAATEATQLLQATEATLALIKTATQLMALWDQTGRAKVVQQKPSTSTLVRVVYVASTSITLLAANANRLGATICNDSSVHLWLKLGVNAADPGVPMPPMAYYEVPFGYTGIVTGYWTAGGSGDALVAELLP